jgi:hypothetical protein
MAHVFAHRDRNPRRLDLCICTAEVKVRIPSFNAVEGAQKDAERRKVLVFKLHL